jgi:MerR family transcriptional regulator/heat shock protein HspR
MEEKAWTMGEAVRLLGVDQEFIEILVREEIVEVRRTGEKGDEVLTMGEIDKIRVARILMEELDVNVAGIEVILSMRQNTIEMRKQFDQILMCLADEFSLILDRIRHVQGAE